MNSDVFVFWVFDVIIFYTFLYFIGNIMNILTGSVSFMIKMLEIIEFYFTVTSKLLLF